MCDHCRTRDGFLRKYDTSGNDLWTTQFGSAGADAPRGVALDTAGHPFVVGDTNGTFSGETSAGATDVFLQKYESG